MTRENKLALVLGFALMLFVGILISDHYSTVQKQVGADLAASDVIEMPLEASITDLEPTRTVASRPAPSTRNNPASRSVSPRSDTAGIVMGSRVTPNTGASRVASSTGGNIHRVASGENLSQISLKYYGDRRHWQQLYESNKDMIRDPDVLPPGTMLRIPGRNVSASASPVEPTRANSTGNTGRYTVMSGDTLSEIAQKVMGSSGRWRDIYKLNKHQLDDPDDVQPGMVILIPANG